MTTNKMYKYLIVKLHNEDKTRYGYYSEVKYVRDEIVIINDIWYRVHRNLPDSYFMQSNQIVTLDIDNNQIITN